MRLSDVTKNARRGGLLREVDEVRINLSRVRHHAGADTRETKPGHRQKSGCGLGEGSGTNERVNCPTRALASEWSSGKSDKVTLTSSGLALGVNCQSTGETGGVNTRTLERGHQTWRENAREWTKSLGTVGEQGQGWNRWEQGQLARSLVCEVNSESVH